MSNEAAARSGPPAPAPPDPGGSEARADTLAVGLGRPFFEELASRRLLPEWLVREARSDPEERISLRTAVRIVDNAVAIAGDPDLGLHAALRNSLQPNVIEYTAVSCKTYGAALETIARYIMVVNEALDFELSEEGGTATLACHDRFGMNRACVDFTVARTYLLHLRMSAPDARAETTVCFQYDKPNHIGVHEKVFGVGRVEFGAPHHALRFPAAYLSEPMERADAGLHAILLRSLQDRLSEVPSRHGLRQRVREVLREEWPHQGLNARTVAERLEMSPRTLARRLEAEGASFRALLDEARCAQALRCLLGENMSTRDTAKLLGFADITSFYKAFRRWFGMTPNQYLEEHGRRA